MNQPYQVLARKYRPQKFKEVVDQQAIVTTLKNAIANECTAHAYLFCGSRGTGKTTLARLLAKALNCQHLSEEYEPCDQCSTCHDITAGHALDVMEIDGASHRGIEDIRQINETVGFAPTNGRYKIYLIDEVHMLTKEAFNALLKTLEEPPPHVKFFFATTEPHKIPATILSRCQRFNLSRISVTQIQEKLTAIASDLQINVEAEATAQIAKLSQGSLRDAESLFDQVMAFENKQVTRAIVDEVLGLPPESLFSKLHAAGPKEDYLVAFDLADELFAAGKNIAYCVEELTSHFRTLFKLKYEPQSTNPLKEIAGLYRIDQLLYILELLATAQQTIKTSPSQRVTFEMLLLQILQSHKKMSMEQLVERLSQLEQQLTSTPQARAPLKIAQPKASTTPKVATPKVSAAPKKKPITPKIEPVNALSPQEQIQEQSRFDTLMRFASKELGGALKKP